MTDNLEQYARNYLCNNTNYPIEWINSLPKNKLFAIYYGQKKKNERKKRGKKYV